MNFKKVLCLCLTFLMLSDTSVFAANSIEQQPSFMDKVAYENWLCETQGADAVEKYNNLSDEQKDKLLNYINNPELIRDAYCIEVGEGERVVLNDGDVKVSFTKTIEEIEENVSDEDARSVDASASRKTTTATYTRTVRLFDYDIFEITGSITYTHNAKTMLSIDGSNIFTSINYVPLLAIDYANKEYTLTKYIAYVTTDVRWNLFSNYGITFGYNLFKVSGDIDDNASGWIGPW